MQANHPARKITRTALIGALLLLGACSSGSGPARTGAVPPPPAAPSAPRPVLRPAPAITAPLRSEWRDMPATPGQWRWSMDGARSVARFAGGQLALSCDRAAARVTLIRQGAVHGTALNAPEGSVPMTVLTTSLTRPLAATPTDGPPAAVAVALQPRDPLLDAMAFSRGRFAVEVAGLPTLYVPAWAEISRVIEDCR